MTTTAAIMEDMFNRAATMTREQNAGTEMTAGQFAAATANAFMAMATATMAEMTAQGRGDLAQRVAAQMAAEAMTAR